jgi:small nuclear ribonucleoprotein (snRNP)-like protein
LRFPILENTVKVELKDGTTLTGSIIEVLEDDSIILRWDKHVSFLSKEIIKKLTVIDFETY